MDSYLSFLEEKEKDKSNGVNFEIRAYQVEIALRSYEYLSNGKNPLVDLPTGAGKTNIAIMVSILAKLSKTDKQAKILYIVPTRILIDQVVDAANWATPELRTLRISEELAANTAHLQASYSRANVIVSTPGIFASLLQSHSISPDTFFENLEFVIVDEFDEFLVLEAAKDGFSVRLDLDFLNLYNQVRRSPFLLMSGTSPLSSRSLAKSQTAEYFSQFTQKVFHPVQVSVPQSHFAKYIPHAEVRIVSCADLFVTACHDALDYKVSRKLDEYQCPRGIRLDWNYILDRLEMIIRGRISEIPLDDGTSYEVDEELKDLCADLLGIVGMYNFLYEDMFADFYPEPIKVPLVIDCEATDLWKDTYRLIDNREKNNEFHPCLMSKAQALTGIIRKHKNEKGLLFTRNTRLSDSLAKYLQAQGINVKLLDARVKPDRERIRIVQQFQEGFPGILILTRSTGRRGLDIPLADYAILYSPKLDEYVIWQELSRIRGTLPNKKPSYILFYSGTSESNRLRRLRLEMRYSSHHYSFSDWYLSWDEQSNPIIRNDKQRGE
jgi:superfamily II DNA/RNA helicase